MRTLAVYCPSSTFSRRLTLDCLGLVLLWSSPPIYFQFRLLYQFHPRLIIIIFPDFLAFFDTCSYQGLLLNDRVQNLDFIGDLAQNFWQL